MYSAKRHLFLTISRAFWRSKVLTGGDMLNFIVELRRPDACGILKRGRYEPFVTSRSSRNVLLIIGRTRI